MPVVVVALGPNDVEVPCLLFEKKGEAETYLMKHLESFDRAGDRFVLTGRTMGHFDAFFDRHGHAIYDPDPNLSASVTAKFFTDYYGGCGPVWAFEIREVEYKTPFTVFNLD